MTAMENLRNDVPQAIESAAVRLATARRTATPCSPVRDLLGTDDVVAAYQVQQRFVDDRRREGARVVGRKIGLTSPVVQQQLGVDQPDFGVLLDDMNVSGIDEVPAGVLLQPKVEAEIAFILAADLDGSCDLETVRESIGQAVAAIEIVDSRIAEWDISITDTVADNASSGLFVLGDQKASLSGFDPKSASMTMWIDDEVVSTGSGADCLGDPLRALQWLAHTTSSYGQPLRSGQVVLSGALGPMVSVRPGSTVRAKISELGSVSVMFAGGDR
ncbi:2-keto-4-pentenoate hydratase [Gordonia aichiensis]|uniref:2-hydroxypenta-2,4-dienoate hydratase CmtF n=1 Tax=Gordonia aichiensis NBRC 108223 TaxID=1220583 RepID=L7KTQ8_9ACTN|nr:fumarylacetoacetate hydrolase family protein [Gordonia aichiensis]GAC51088.1 2-hydroxypenta-2,4-dienoate hydratase CmtF [Gordonia aichiensis NBRC 108223]